MARYKTFDDFPPVLTTGEAAELLRVTPQALRNWRWRGRGPKFVRVSANRVRYTRDDIVAWVKDQTFSSTTEAETASALQRASVA